MEVVADGVVYESFLRLWLRPGLPFEDHVVVPSIGTSHVYWKADYKHMERINKAA